MGRGAAVAAFLHEAAAGEQVRDGARRRPIVNARMAGSEYGEQLARAPEGVRFARADEELGHRL